MVFVLTILSCGEEERIDLDGQNQETCDHRDSGSSLDLSDAPCDLFSNIWGPGSNSITIGGGLYSTRPGVGWSQEYGGIHVKSFSIVGEVSDFITSSSERAVKVEGPENSIIEVWDLEAMEVVSTNINNAGTPTIFNALPNHRYGGFAWYTDNGRRDMAIYASFTCDHSRSGSSLDLSDAPCDLFSNIWGPGSNSIIIGGGLNYSTRPGVGWSQEYGGIYVTSFSIVGEGSDLIASSSESAVKVEGPEGSIIEVWDLEAMEVVSTNINNAGTPTIFNALPDHRYGGFAWYADNGQRDMAIFASFACDHGRSGSSLDLSDAPCNLFSYIWGPGSNSIIIGGGLNYSTRPGVGWSQEYGGIYVTSFSIVGEGSDFITSSSESAVKVEGPENSVIEVWDLEAMEVISTNIDTAGTPTIFNALPNHRYGGFAWYTDNGQRNIAIRASFN